MTYLKEHNNDLVSVIVPVYNGGKYLQECLESVENQTYKNFECIINNNKSNDNTLEIAEKFSERDKRFRIFNNDNFLGQTENWNISVSRISGESKYIKIVPADDWLFPECLQEMVKLMDSYPSTGICSSYRLDENKVRCDGLDYYKGPVFPGKEILYRQLLQDIEITGSINTVMYRTSVLKSLHGYPDIFDVNSYHIDTILAYEVLRISDLAFVNQVLSFTRRHNETYTNNISDRFKTSYYANETFLYRHMDKFPNLKPLYDDHRLDYAFFLIKKRLKGDKECFNWHNKHLIQPIRFSEYLKSILTRVLLINRIGKKSSNIYKKRKYITEPII